MTEFTFGTGGTPAKRGRYSKKDNYPDLTEMVKELPLSNGGDKDWAYIEFALADTDEQIKRDEYRLAGALRHRIQKQWPTEHFQCTIRPRLEDASPGCNRIWFRVTRK